MAATPLTVAFVLGMVLVSVLGGWLMLRADDSPADRRVARGGGRPTSSAARCGPGPRARLAHPRPTEGRPSLSTPSAASEASRLPARRHRATGHDPFRAETWPMEHRNAGAIGGAAILRTGSRCRSTCPRARSLPGLRRHRRRQLGAPCWPPSPRHSFEHGRAWTASPSTAAPRGAERLLPLGAELRAEELWVIVWGREVTLVREGSWTSPGSSAGSTSASGSPRRSPPLDAGGPCCPGPGSPPREIPGRRCPGRIRHLAFAGDDAREREPAPAGGDRPAVPDGCHGLHAAVGELVRIAPHDERGDRDPAELLGGRAPAGQLGQGARGGSPATHLDGGLPQPRAGRQRRRAQPHGHVERCRSLDAGHAGTLERPRSPRPRQRIDASTGTARSPRPVARGRRSIPTRGTSSWTTCCTTRGTCRTSSVWWPSSGDGSRRRPPPGRR